MAIAGEGSRFALRAALACALLGAGSARAALVSPNALSVVDAIASPAPDVRGSLGVSIDPPPVASLSPRSAFLVRGPWTRALLAISFDATSSVLLASPRQGIALSGAAGLAPAADPADPSDLPAWLELIESDPTAR